MTERFATSLPGAIPSGTVFTIPISPLAAKLSIHFISAASSAVFPPISSTGLPAAPSVRTIKYFIAKFSSHQFTDYFGRMRPNSRLKLRPIVFLRSCDIRVRRALRRDADIPFSLQLFGKPYPPLQRRALQPVRGRRHRLPSASCGASGFVNTRISVIKYNILLLKFSLLFYHSRV